MPETPAEFGCVFDCDGTLIDSMVAWREVEDELARLAGVKLTKEQTDLITTLTLPEVGDFFHDQLGVGNSPQDVLDLVDEFMADFYSNRAKPRPGALEFVQVLAARGVPMAVASSTPSALLRAGIEHAGFAPYMRAVVSVDDVGHSKREPHVYDCARESLGTPRHCTFGFEDAAYALDTLRTAGYRTVGVYDCDLSGTYEQLLSAADRTVRSFHELNSERFPE
ncbi:HAD family phosphatase [Adlercreutzia sp. ZJ138]|uniref:HAD family hydrolase n=1 Tax=Adlercreutzia sp. ZJ138 TaxID=2709405 RepID=UPI0013EA9784|nr:HAD family phosphatase [Adlercreutzia sp. ZJ138]